MDINRIVIKLMADNKQYADTIKQSRTVLNSTIRQMEADLAGTTAKQRALYNRMLRDHQRHNAEIGRQAERALREHRQRKERQRKQDEKDARQAEAAQRRQQNQQRQAARVATVRNIAIAGLSGRLLGGSTGGTMGFLGGTVGGAVGGPIGAAAGGAIGAVAGTIFHFVGKVLSIVESGMRAAFGVISKAVVMGMEYERTKVGFGVLAGDRGKGEKLFEDLQQLAIHTPYESKELYRPAQTLLGFGNKPEEVIPILSRLGDIAAGDMDKLNRLTLAFGQTTSAGRFLATELRQFTEAGVGIKDFADAAGISVAEFREKMFDGAIGVDVMIKGINKLTNQSGRFFGLSERINLESVEGQWKSLMERIQVFTAKSMEKIFKELRIAEWIGLQGDKLFGIEKHMDKVVDLAKSLWDIFKGVATAVEAVVTALGKMTLSMQIDDLQTKTENFIVRILDMVKVLVKVGEKLLGMTPGNKQAIADAIVEQQRQFDQNAKMGRPADAWENRKGFTSKAWNTLRFFGDPNDPETLVTAQKFLDAAGEVGSASGFIEQWQNEIKDLQNKRLIDESMIGNRAVGIAMMGMNAVLKNPTPDIANEKGISNEAKRFATEIRKSMTEGISPYDKFQRSMKLIDEATNPFSGMENLPFAGAFAESFANMGKTMSMAQRRHAMGTAYLDLERNAGINEPNRLTPSIMYGSAEAAEAIARSSAFGSVKDKEKQMLDVLKDQAKESEEIKNNTGRAADALEKWGVSGY